MKIFSSISLILLGITLPASADYVVDEDLGTLPEGSTTVSFTVDMSKGSKTGATSKEHAFPSWVWALLG